MYSEKTLNLLELPAILNMLAKECTSDSAKDMALKLKPYSDEKRVSHELSETSAAVQLMVKKGAPSFSGVKDVSASLHRAEMSGLLNTVELLTVAQLLRTARTAKQYIADDRLEATCIDNMFYALSANKYLEDRISNTILSEDEIADSASPELLAIRKKIRQESANIRASLQKIISSPSYAKALQEPIVTLRSGRYVVPVKVEHKNEIPGLVHDVSSSGMTVFIEPMAAVKSNNELKELEIKEKNEIERILYELSAECAKYADAISSDMNLLIKLDFIFGKAKLAYSMNAVMAQVSEGRSIVLRKARHPLIDPAKVVPMSISLGEEFDTLVITGPNTGGKTVSLKTIGLLALMNQCGLHIPAADGSSLPVFSKVLADIGDEQSIEQSLSTFSAHMKNIVGILEECDDASLVMFDELGAGTDPTEGAALAVSIIEYVRSKKALVAATTHYSELKVYALNEPGVQNASCEFDVQTLKPTYKIIVGIPGKSNAFAISSKLGLPESVVKEASKRIDRRDSDFENTVAGLDEIREKLEQELSDADAKLRAAAESERKANLIRAELEVRLEKADIKAKRDAQRIIDEAKRTAEETFAELDEMRSSINEETEANEINRQRNALRKKLNDAAPEHKLDSPVNDMKSARAAKKGDTVIIKSMNMKAVVTDILPDGTLSLRAGIINVNVKEDDVFVTDEVSNNSKNNRAAASTQLRSEAFSSEVDLRGMESIEAVLVAEQYIDNAVMNKLNTVTIIHGKGTGALRSAIHQMLRQNKMVKSYRLGRIGEGDNGVTVVELK